MTTVDPRAELFARPAPSRRVPGIHFDATPTAQAYRRQRLEPDAILAHLRDWRDRGDVQWAALGLIEMTGYLQCPAEERVTLIDRVMDALAVVNDETPVGAS